MRVELNISADILEPYAVINASEISDEVSRIVAACETQDKIVAIDDTQRMSVISPEEIFMVRVEEGRTIIYMENSGLITKKRLYEIREQLGNDFMQISKAAFINLNKLDYVEPYFSGMMNIVLKNGKSEFISRKYLPEFKKHLGI